MHRRLKLNHSCVILRESQTLRILSFILQLDIVRVKRYFLSNHSVDKSNGAFVFFVIIRVSKMASVIIDHSFVKRAQKYVQTKTSMLHLRQFSYVFCHGIGVKHVRDEIHMISDLECSVFILDVGTNKIANKIVVLYGVKVVLIQQFNRKQTGKYSI